MCCGVCGRVSRGVGDGVWLLVDRAGESRRARLGSEGLSVSSDRSFFSLSSSFFFSFSSLSLDTDRPANKTKVQVYLEMFPPQIQHESL